MLKRCSFLLALLLPIAGAYYIRLVLGYSAGSLALSDFFVSLLNAILFACAPVFVGLRAAGFVVVWQSDAAELGTDRGRLQFSLATMLSWVAAVAIWMAFLSLTPRTPPNLGYMSWMELATWKN